VLLLRGRIDHLARDRAPLRLIAVEQKGGVPDPVKRECKLPSEIGGVLDAGIRPLSAGGAMNMGGVSAHRPSAARPPDAAAGVRSEDVWLI
jgi:hypothetical protein